MPSLSILVTGNLVTTYDLVSYGFSPNIVTSYRVTKLPKLPVTRLPVTKYIIYNIQGKG